jgi:tetratricopeptide (TPR) repeat protein
MKKNMFGITASIISGVFLMILLALPMLAQTQKDFSMGRNNLAERFKRATPFYLEGAKQFNKGDLDKAEKKFLEALEIMPEHADAAFMLAKLQLQRKEFSKALASIDTAKKNYVYIAQFQALTHQHYFDSLRQQRQQLEEQRNQLQGALASMPSSATSEDKAPLEKSIQSITQTMQTIDSRLASPIPTIEEIPADYFFIHGNVFYRMGMLDDAAAQYLEAIRLDPVHGDAYNNLALVSFSQGRYQKALEYLVRAEGAGVKINPEFKRAIEAKLSPQ